jgi:hypothetical protein
MMKYQVRYMCGGAGELLGSDLTMEQAQRLVDRHADGMHEEQVADLVIRKQPSVKVAQS